jgi:hypothetical protein
MKRPLWAFGAAMQTVVDRPKAAGSATSIVTGE